MSAFTSTRASVLRMRCIGSRRTDWCGLVGRLHHCNRSPLLASVAGAVVPMGSSYSLSTSSYPKEEEDQRDERNWTLLYHRDPSRAITPRALLGVSTFNMFYWTWYCADFTRAINASAHERFALGQIDSETLEMILVDPTMGYLGLGISCVIWLGSYLYSKQLVSAIWGSQPTSVGEESLLAVSTLKLPFMAQPKILKRTVYNPENNDFDGVENIVFTESDLRSVPNLEVYALGELALAEDSRINDVIVRFDGDFSRLRGHIALMAPSPGDDRDDESLLATLRQTRYIADISSSEEFTRNASPALLHSLVIRDPNFEISNMGGHDSGKADKTRASAAKKRKTQRPSTEKRRHVTQLEMARRTVKNKKR